MGVGWSIFNALVELGVAVGSVLAAIKKPRESHKLPFVMAALSFILFGVLFCCEIVYWCAKDGKASVTAASIGLGFIFNISSVLMLLTTYLWLEMCILEDTYTKLLTSTAVIFVVFLLIFYSEVDAAWAMFFFLSLVLSVIPIIILVYMLVKKK